MPKKYYFTAFVLLAAVFSVGPMVDIDETITAPQLPSDIDSYIQDSESQIPDIQPGTEKKLIWVDPVQRTKTPYSLVYLHGFSATRQEIAPVSDKVAKALGANLYYTRLTGHGRSGEAMADITVNAMLNDAVDAMRIGAAIGDKVILVGTSTGATLATWLAGYENNETIAALILISPNYGPKRIESELLLLPWGNILLDIVQGPEYQFDTVNEHHQQYWTSRYPSKALLPMMGLVKLTRNKDFSEIHQPVLVMYSPNDSIVSTKKIRKYYALFGSDTRRIVAMTNTGDPANHVLGGRILSPHTTDEIVYGIVNFIKESVF